LELARTLLQRQRERAAALRPPVSDSDSEEDAAPEDEADAQDEADAENLVQRLLRLCGIDVTRCPACQTGRLVREPLPHQSLATGIGSDTS
jgi:hypothetical protein